MCWVYVSLSVPKCQSSCAHLPLFLGVSFHACVLMCVSTNMYTCVSMCLCKCLQVCGLLLLISRYLAIIILGYIIVSCGQCPPNCVYMSLLPDCVHLFEQASVHMTTVFCVPMYMGLYYIFGCMCTFVYLRKASKILLQHISWCLPQLG